MPPESSPDAFRVELCASLISFYEDVLKVPGAGGHSEARIIKSPLTCRRSPPPAEVSTAAGGEGVTSREATPPVPPAAAAAEAAPAAGKPNRGKGVAVRPVKSKDE